MTGSNTSIGKKLVQILYTKHAKVYIAARTLEKALEAIQEVRKTTPSSAGDLVFLHVDLAGLTTIKA